MRAIDANELKKGIEQQFCTACDSRNGVRCSACDVADCLMRIDDAPTIEAITLEEFKEKSEQVVEEFVGDNKTADMELMVHAMLIGLALGNLGLRLFGGVAGD